MFASTIFAVLASLAVASATPFSDNVKRQSGETHDVQLINNCGSGTPLFLYQGNATPQGSTTVSGELAGGVAWLDGFSGPGGTCTTSGVNCGDVEFTLVNQGTDPSNTQNAIDYSLQTQGNHVYAYSMNAQYTNGGSCQGPPGPCTGSDQSSCPGAFVGTDTTGGTVYQCSADNVGITITFCP